MFEIILICTKKQHLSISSRSHRNVELKLLCFEATFSSQALLWLVSLNNLTKTELNLVPSREFQAARHQSTFPK
jgi:hypothetical protein